MTPGSPRVDECHLPRLILEQIDAQRYLWEFIEEVFEEIKRKTVVESTHAGPVIAELAPEDWPHACASLTVPQQFALPSCSKTHDDYSEVVA